RRRIGSQPDDAPFDLSGTGKMRGGVQYETVMLVASNDRNVGRLGVTVALDVDQQRIAAVRDGSTRVEYDRQRVLTTRAATNPVSKNWSRVGAGPEHRGNHAPHRGSSLSIAGVTHAHGELVVARFQRDALLQQDALV